MELDVRDREMILAWKDLLSAPIVLNLHQTGDERSAGIARFCAILKELLPNVRIVSEQGADSSLPNFAIGERWRFFAVPAGNELGPFLELLVMQARGRADLSSETQKTLEKVQLAASFKVFVTPSCPFCPEVVRQVQQFPLVRPNINVDIIDGSLFPELAQQHGVRSAPTVILGDQFRWSGSIVLPELLNALVHRDPARLSADEILSIIKEGQAVHLASLMLQENVVFPAFLELLRHPNWSERLGGIVVLEHIAEQNQQLAKTVCAQILKYLKTAEGPVKGDLIYLVGLAGCSEALDFLKELLAVEQSADTREVLLEALEKLGAQDQ